MKSILTTVFFGMTLALAAQAQTEFDREDFDQPELARPTPAAPRGPAPEGMERVVGTPRILGYGFKKKQGQHIISIACVGTGTPASCGRLRHIVSTGDGKDTFFFGPTYTLNASGEPSDDQVKQFITSINATYKDAKFPRKWRIVAGFGALLSAFFVPVAGVSYLLFFGGGYYLNSGAPPIMVSHGKVMALIEHGDPRWPTMGNKGFTRYMNLITANGGERFNNYLLATGRD